MMLISELQKAIDVGHALEVMLQDDSTASETYELYGPKNYSMAEIAELVDREIIKHRRHINVPKRILKPVANILNKVLWWPTMSADGIEREFLDQRIDPKAKTFKDLGIEPAELSNLTFHYLVSPRSVMLQWFFGLRTSSRSKHTEARHSMICPRQRSARRGRRRNICMSLTINSLLSLRKFEWTWFLGGSMVVNNYQLSPIGTR